MNLRRLSALLAAALTGVQAAPAGAEIAFLKEHLLGEKRTTTR